MALDIQNSRTSSSPRNEKGLREVDQVRQIAAAHGGKVTCTPFGGSRHLVTISLFGTAEDDPRLRAMLYAIEFAIRGQFDRGRSYPGMKQFAARSRFVDVVVRCVQ